MIFDFQYFTFQMALHSEKPTPIGVDKSLFGLGLVFNYTPIFQPICNWIFLLTQLLRQCRDNFQIERLGNFAHSGQSKVRITFPECFHQILRQCRKNLYSIDPSVPFKQFFVNIIPDLPIMHSRFRIDKDCNTTSRRLRFLFILFGILLALASTPLSLT